MRTFVYGASGHGKVVLDILLAGGHEVTGFIDDGRAPGSWIMGVEIVGGFETLAREAARGSVGVALGIGDNRARRAIAERCLTSKIVLVTAIHPRAAVAKSATIGQGTVVMANAVVNPEARVGICAIVNSGAIVEHDCRLGDFSHISPNAALGGGACVGELSHVGLAAAVLPLKAVGNRTTVGAGAVVHRDLPDDVVAAGVPARILRRLG